MLELDSALLKDLEAGTVVVPSAQRATAVHLAHAAAQLQRGRKLWRSPNIRSYTDWLERAAVRATVDGAPIPRVLRGAEDWLHWRDVVRDAAEVTGIVFDQSLAESLRRSAHLLHDWRIPQSALRRGGGDESQLLARVLRRFESRCAELQATASYRLPELVQSWHPQRPVTFAGFIEPAPAQSSLMERRHVVAGGIAASAFIAKAVDPADEIALVAQWCRDHLRTDPRRRLLIVVPDLSQRRAAVLRTLGQVLSPQLILGNSGHATAAGIAVEGGQPLAGFPLVSHALNTLRLLVAQLDFSVLNAWLRAPFWRMPGESERIRLDLWLRNWLRPETNASDLREQLNTVPTSLTPAATQLLTALDGALAVLDQQFGSTAQWARRFAIALAAFGWPGARPLNSAEHQTRSRFMELLDEFAALGPGVGRMSSVEAVSTLHALAARVAFEPATGDAAVTLTDALTDPIVRYDGVWIVGLHAEIWPRPVQIDPFIPLAAQREAGIPASSAAGRLQQARAVLNVWRSSTAQLVMSWAQRDEDGEHLPSALLHEMEGVAAWRASPRLPTLTYATRGACVMETFEDPAGAPWSRAIVLPSGTRSLEYQNLCPFRAYAELRLHCVRLETPRPGVDWRDRGRLLHRALEYLWTRLGDSQGLAEHVAEKREALIEECIARATRDCFDEMTLREAPRAVARERRRALRLIVQLCELEERRAPFRVQALEARRALTIAGASLDVRIDRIDELADGTLVIFDYKTGKPRPQDWLAERPANPQLLVYLRAAQAPVAALAAVHLTAARVIYRGVADLDDRLPAVDGIADGWEEQLSRWRRHVEQLASDFLAGRAVLDPLGDACRTCHLHGFCRIADAELTAEDADHDD